MHWRSEVGVLGHWEYLREWVVEGTEGEEVMFESAGEKSMR